MIDRGQMVLALLVLTGIFAGLSMLKVPVIDQAAAHDLFVFFAGMCVPAVTDYLQRVRTEWAL